jgi:hypothetical protein
MTQAAIPLTETAIGPLVQKVVHQQPVTDMHTHCFAPTFGACPEPKGLLLWGIDQLVTYHYLIAEAFRVVPATQLPYDTFWSMSLEQQADHIWKTLFVDRCPISEACRGVVTTLSQLGLDPNEKTLKPYRRWFAQQNPSAFVDRVMDLANVDMITMTNEVFDDHERQLWLDDPSIGDDPRFAAVLRIDALLLDWPDTAKRLNDWGYAVKVQFDQQTLEETRRFLRDWIKRIKSIYVAVSLPPDFAYPSMTNDGKPDATQTLLDQVVLPVLAESNMALAMMIGVRRGANPALRGAGDIGGQADVLAVANLCAAYPQNRFLVTMLSRQNQHELCVIARIFGNLMVFGCWWFVNNPSLIEEITTMRFELLGTSFVPQHSDARILDQLIYKWSHSRKIIANVLTQKYIDLLEAGYQLTAQRIEQDAALLLRDNFRQFVGC